MSTSKSQRGFTLIELIISVGLFAVISTVAATAYLNLINLDRRTQASTDMVNNLSFTLDSMARAIRTGSNYKCTPSGSPQVCSQFSFSDAAGCTIVYQLSGATIQQIGQDTSAGCDTTTPSFLVDSRVLITKLYFFVSGLQAGSADNLQPQVVITITGSLPVSSAISPIPFTIQTSATSRVIDI